MTIIELESAVARIRIGWSVSFVKRTASEPEGPSPRTLPVGSSSFAYDPYRGMRLKNYDRAKAISDATEGAVSIQELCEKEDE